MTVRARRAWKKQDNQQQKARQDRLNSSRKHRCEDHGDAADVSLSQSTSDHGSAFEIGRNDRAPEDTSQGKSERESDSLRDSNKQIESFQPYPTVAEVDVVDNGKSGRLGEQIDVVIPSNDLQVDDPHQQSNNGGTDGVEETLRSHQYKQPPIPELEAFQSAASSLDEKNLCRKAISGDRLKLEVHEVSLEEDHGDDATAETTSKSLSSRLSIAGIKAPRRQDCDSDRNPKPSKRRRSVQGFSEVSLKYRVESFVGFDDRLHDGFYDAGRDRPFLPLDVLEKEQLCYDSREVILVDR